ncbi:MAG: hypothetical protein AABY22_17360, partial [Nanoarchaeota archaeon]
YRTPGSWITSPYIAAAILCLGKTIMFESLNNMKFKWQSFVNSDDFTSMKTAKVKRNFPKIWKDITKMQLYQKYKPYIDLLYFLVNSNLTWFPSVTMKNAWGIANLHDYTRSKINLDVIWLKYNSLRKTKKV